MDYAVKNDFFINEETRHTRRGQLQLDFHSLEGRGLLSDLTVIYVDG